MNTLCPLPNMQQHRQQQGSVSSTWQIGGSYFQRGRSAAGNNNHKRPWHQFSHFDPSISATNTPPQHHTVRNTVSEKEKYDRNYMDSTVDMSISPQPQPASKRQRTVFYSMGPTDSPFLHSNWDNSNNHGELTMQSSNQGGDIAMNCSPPLMITDNNRMNNLGVAENGTNFSIPSNSPPPPSTSLPTLEWWKRPHHHISIPIPTVQEEDGFPPNNYPFIPSTPRESNNSLAPCHVCRTFFSLPATPQVDDIMPTNSILNYFSKKPRASTSMETIEEEPKAAAAKNPASCSCCDRFSCNACRHHCDMCRASFCSFCVISEEQLLYCLDCHRDVVGAVKATSARTRNEDENGMY
ncbi:hypothetical protein IV203_011831 [Nitzschia inconspicua]|uniref:Uncharacterized protein n=1 Tax=Nitzschia inconspicua TaxID=303405 RepID=A0A9K3KSJ0_9STRA|nr:hypothetical protein IV203_011831 [Nitzschia inconspicua]